MGRFCQTKGGENGLIFLPYNLSQLVVFSGLPIGLRVKLKCTSIILKNQAVVKPPSP